MNIQNKVNYSI